jgi:YjbE family integral membrane protein
MAWALVVSLAEIVWIDLLLSGDNAVVIALVCRELPAHQQKIGMVFGTVAAILARIVMALTASLLLAVEGLRIFGGLFVLWVAFGLLKNEGDEKSGVRAPSSLFSAIFAIAVADASMSLDNVMAIAAIAKGYVWLMVVGVALSIPLVIVGAAVIKGIVDRFPWIVWIGSGLLAWVGGAIILDDPILSGLSMPTITVEASPLSVACCGAVLVAGLIYRNRKSAETA